MKKVLSLAVTLVALAAAAEAPGATSGIVGQWHFDEGAGRNVADSSGNGNGGTLEPGVTWVSGRFGSALSFDGFAGRVTVKDNLALEPVDGVSVSAWVRATKSPGNYRYIVAKGATGCIAASYGLYSGPGGGLEFYISMGRGTNYVRSPDTGTGIWDGQWHMVVGTFDGNVVRLFVDGAEIGHGNPRVGHLEYMLPDSNDFFIGDYPGCATHTFRGAIDEVDVWNAALSAAGAGALYAQESRTPTGGQTPVIDGGTAPSGTGSGPGTGSGTGTGARSHMQTPAIHGLRLSPSRFSFGHSSRPRAHDRMPGTTISYTDTLAARVTFRVLTHRSGIVRARHCAAPPAHGAVAHAKRCTRTVVLASFSRRDHGGRTTFRFTGVRGHRLVPGRYLLQATPRVGTRNGTAATAPFTVIA